ncbi:hypothetical protein [uncultured Ellagibacter sp.]|uniref:hypothetical protein n=1 Tax=uncultured Ellagibacter sp. TaxID=2137580 RepID=UPI0025DE6431|nr:hypothetical protein [uncultured Ellagibacter sp.]
MSVGFSHSDSSHCDLDERDTFFRALFHDDRNSSYALATCIDGTWRESMHKHSHLSFIGAPSNGSLYVSVNGFSGDKRRLDSLRQINTLFFDLDCHGSSGSQTDSAIRRSLAIIDNAVRAGKLPCPTLIVDSGRGLHLYYVLKRSIPYRCSANGPVNEKALRLFRRVQQNLSRTLSHLMDPIDSIDVDEKVFDFTRVSRVPGSFNPAAQRYARLLSSSDSYYDLSELNAKLGVFAKHVVSSETRHSTNAIFSKKHGDDSPLLRSRLANVISLQALRNFDCEGSRELMCFVLYNTAVQLVGPSDASRQLCSFNSRFTQPLSQAELDSVVRSVDRVVNVRGQRGYYVLSAKRIVEMLALTEQEKIRIQFHTSTRSIIREKAKEATASRRALRDKRITKLYRSGDFTQNEIAQRVGCSLRTVASVLSRARRQHFSSLPKLQIAVPFVVQQHRRIVLCSIVQSHLQNEKLLQMRLTTNRAFAFNRPNSITTWPNHDLQNTRNREKEVSFNKQHENKSNKILSKYAIFCHTCLSVVRLAPFYSLNSSWVV